MNDEDKIIEAIKNLRIPHQDVVDNVQPIIEGLADAAFKKTKSPVVKSNLQKIKDILSKFFSKFKVG